MDGWIGVDLDGTLAEYNGWIGPEHIGRPIKPMMDRVNEWIEAGIKVKIFTARANIPEQIPYITKWLVANGLPALEITATKDFAMLELYDDRCVQVLINSGITMQEFLEEKIEKLKNNR